MMHRVQVKVEVQHKTKEEASTIEGEFPSGDVMWVEFVGSRPCSERFFSGFSGFPLSSKTNITRILFDLDYCRTIYHKLLAREIALSLRSVRYSVLVLFDKMFHTNL